MTADRGLAKTYLALPAQLRQRVAEVERLLKAAAGFPLGLAAAVRVFGVAVIVGAHPLGALLFGSLGLGFRLRFGDASAGTARHAAAGQPVLLCLQLSGQTRVGILAGALALLLFARRRQRDLNLAVDARVVCVVGGRLAVGAVLGGLFGGGAGGGSWDGLGGLGGHSVEAGFDQGFDSVLA